jgi:predicted amidohydrolase
VRVAAWQCRPGTRDVAGNLRRLEHACAEAAERGAELLVTPEMFTTGYALAPPDLARLAEDPGGPTEQAVAAIASRTGVAVAYGYPERTPDGIYNAATLVGPGGVIVGRHRKAHLFGDFDRRLFRPGPEPPAAFDVPRGRAGLLICYDVEFPETVRDLAADGARLVLVPTANMTEYPQVPLEIVPRRARDNGCAVVYANYAGADDAFAYGGLSVVCGPSGEVLAQAGPAAEELLVTDIKIFLSRTNRGGCPAIRRQCVALVTVRDLTAARRCPRT